MIVSCPVCQINDPVPGIVISGYEASIVDYRY